MTITIGEPCPPEIVEEHVSLIDYTKRPGVSGFGVCNVCGYAQLEGTTEMTDSENVAINASRFVWSDSKDCPKCADVWRRTPELFIWVLQTHKIEAIKRQNP